jgi:hypothetical protein
MAPTVTEISDDEGDDVIFMKEILNVPPNEAIVTGKIRKTSEYIMTKLPPSTPLSMKSVIPTKPPGVTATKASRGLVVGRSDVIVNRASENVDNVKQLVNFGVSCYLSAILQVLCHTEVCV